ncbi:S-layer homology domain-containing protein [Texcoconibacillus texcoconensis]|uniref:SLH domain-containing protein n=1 Tax=Texcoconibacillus texcoconensis TaxID=1095777 RepID=A0A840QSS5_9BACI|nr:S-layer homology domain-containing protein [Texcoconibacillus texcoconensis]MBB5174576.1 hypothetical protein [Texcoconibacillus texcoconensis]
MIHTNEVMSLEQGFDTGYDEPRYTFDGDVVSEELYNEKHDSYYERLEEVDTGSVSITGRDVVNFQRNTVNVGKIGELIDSFESTAVIDEPSNWAQEEVSEAMNLNLVPERLQYGYEDDITRADFSVLVVHLLKEKTGQSIQELLVEHDLTLDVHTFDDTSDYEVLSAHAFGIVKGHGDGTFDPEGAITRQEAASMLTKTADVLDLDTRSHMDNPGFSDQDHIADWATDDVAFVSTMYDRTNGLAIMTGTGNDRFSPLDSYTREQSFMTLKRLFNVESL